MDLSNNVLTSSYNQFSFDVYRQVAANSSDSNVFLCTFSILSALSMCLPGAKENTERQLKQLMNFQNVPNQAVYNSNLEMLNYFSTSNLKGNLTMNMANKIYPHANLSLKPQFTDVLKSNFKSDVQPLDYANAQVASQTINDWVEKQTMGKIKDLIPSSAIDPLTRMILVNAVYFKGSWSKPFEAYLTTTQPFHLLDGLKRDVDMMERLGQFKHVKNPNGLRASVCEFPYAGEQISMSVILPDDGVNLSEIEAQLSNQNVLTSVFEANRFVHKVQVYLPKFKLEQMVELSGFLSNMGASDPFNQTTADFSGMTSDITPPNNLYISKVIHKAIVEVNEEGTVAAGATVIFMNNNNNNIGFEEIAVFKCDRPFLFLIHDTIRHDILFIGRYTQP